MGSETDASVKYEYDDAEKLSELLIVARQSCTEMLHDLRRVISPTITPLHTLELGCAPLSATLSLVAHAPGAPNVHLCLLPGDVKLQGLSCLLLARFLPSTEQGSVEVRSHHECRQSDVFFLHVSSFMHVHLSSAPASSPLRAF